MRSVLALALLCMVAAQDSPITGMISWLKEHGEEVVETLDECKDVPSIIHSFKEQSKECYADKTTADKAAIALWYAITGLEHMNGTVGEFVKHSPMIEKIKVLATTKAMSLAHESANKLCGQDKCEDKVKEMRSKISSCYASLSCNFMGKVIPFAPCKAALDKYMEATMDVAMETMCQSDSMQGATVYCADLSSGWMLKDFDCYMESARAATPNFKCTPKCQKEWAFAKAQMPKCSHVVTNLSNHILENVKTMYEDMAKDAKIDMSDMIKHLPNHLPTYDEKCGQHDRLPTWKTFRHMLGAKREELVSKIVKSPEFLKFKQFADIVV